MNIAEIRIGNYFLGYDNEIFRWDLEHFELVIKGIYPDEIGMPIEITEDLLLKLGLMYDEDDFRLYNLTLENRATDEFSKDINPEDFGVWIFNVYIKEIRYLHQLQNLVYELYNKELEIK